ncbi:MAG: biotin--[acetyl-CoA-carboxylase] ligase [Pseudomonadota bacterium]
MHPAPDETLTLASGHVVQIYGRLASTSQTARQLVENAPAAPTGLWVMADQQTDGVGRRGRTWHQQHGDFAATLILPLPTRDEGNASHSFIAALSVREAIAAIFANTSSAQAPGPTVQVKWPNDILVNGQKTAGLLLELILREGRAFLTLGIGINVVGHPADLPYPATHLGAHLGPDDPMPQTRAILKSIDTRLMAWRRQWQTSGFEPVRAAWLAAAAGLGKDITVRLPDRTVTGRFAGLDASGQLILGTAVGTELINTGDVFFGALPSD